MDSLGERIIRDEAEISRLNALADRHERDARAFRQQAAEIARLLDLARFAQRG